MLINVYDRSPDPRVKATDLETLRVEKDAETLALEQELEDLARQILEVQNNSRVIYLCTIKCAIE